MNHHQSWRLNIQAKAKSFHFKLSATSLFRHCNCTFFQFSLKLKLFTLFLITLKSEPTISSPTTPTSSNSRLRRFLQKLRIRRRPRSAQTQKNSENVRFDDAIVGLLSRSVFKKGKDGVFILGSTTLLCVTWLFKHFLRRNLWVFMVLLVASVVGFSGIMDFWNHFNEDSVAIRHFWEVNKPVFNKFF
ncbi:PREDICTED: uncharacterized protein LOC109179197 [Ipomoea nil]|uniref:uncharacterized protein LOC109179197 n=1 Tax=Ipomoea nil TaxID=35883 RepID=UPI0009012439|nr:PREDICTED: uncharacterized protein LOC109179197 [Ipomoea nil]